MKKDLLNLYNLSREDFDNIFTNAAKLKRMLKKGIPYTPLAGKTLGMIFDKSSTRTRISFEVGMYQLGGVALFLATRDTQLGRGENIADTARVMSRYLNAIMIRTYSQESVEEFAKYATIPVINGLTDLLHPCQILSDIFTIIEKKETYEGIKVAYVGDGNNVANTWIEAATKLPFYLSLGCPKGFEPDSDILKRGMKEAMMGIELHHDPFTAVAGADVIYTDVWTSMGQEDEKEKRKKIFRTYQVNKKLIEHAGSDVVIMHCLPAHRGEEITDEVIDGLHSIVIDEAENRLHVQKAVLEILMQGGYYS
jgi:ornithine carbamoyltransferase